MVWCKTSPLLQRSSRMGLGIHGEVLARRTHSRCNFSLRVARCQAMLFLTSQLLQLNLDTRSINVRILSLMRRQQLQIRRGRESLWLLIDIESPSLAWSLPCYNKQESYQELDSLEVLRKQPRYYHCRALKYMDIEAEEHNTSSELDSYSSNSSCSG